MIQNKPRDPPGQNNANMCYRIYSICWLILRKWKIYICFSAPISNPNHKCTIHDDVIKWKHFPHCWPFVRGIHRSEFPAQRPVTRSFDVFFDLCLNKRLSNNHEADDLRRYRAHYDVTVMCSPFSSYRYISEQKQFPQNALKLPICILSTNVMYLGPLLLTWFNFHPCMDT